MTWTKERRAKVSRLIRCLYGVVREFEKEFATAERKFTPDGHLVGSLGEVVAAYAYDLELHSVGEKAHDAKTRNGKQVQIKLTGCKGTDSEVCVGLRAEPEHLIVLQLRDYKFTELYT